MFIHSFDFVMNVNWYGLPVPHSLDATQYRLGITPVEPARAESLFSRPKPLL